MFWTIKKESGTDTGWSLENARAASTVPPDFSNYLVIPSTTTAVATANGDASRKVDKNATMRAALKGFNQKLINYPALHGRPGAVASSATSATGKDQNGVEESQMPEAQSQLFQQGFEVGFADAQTFAQGLQLKDGSFKPGRIGHVDLWKRARTLQFLDAQEREGKAGKKLWQKLIQKKAKSESDDGRLKRAWEFMDGMDAGIKAVQEQGQDAGGKTEAEKWGEQLKKSFETAARKK